MKWVLFLSTFLYLQSFISCVQAQQEYSGNSVLSCNNNDEAKPSPAFLYTCNGKFPSCRAFLIFRARAPFTSLSTIAALTSSNLSEIARINNVSRFTVFPPEKEVIVPVKCSCSGKYYQANTTYNIPADYETYFMIANRTYQGLSSCDSLKRSNVYNERSLKHGLELDIPLRCACPTEKQIENGTKFLMTYSVTWGDKIPYLSEMFNVSASMIAEANGFSEEDPVIFPFTTILVPLPIQPSSLRRVNQIEKPATSPQPTFNHSKKGKLKRNLILTCGIAAGIFLLALVLLFCILVCVKGKGARGTRVLKGKDIPSKDLLVEIASIDHALKVFTFYELKKATGSFSHKNRISGCVYRGVYKDKIYAVKRMSIDASEEVNLLNRINHSNLINLRGFCEYRGGFYLVFEYMENGSLREWLSRNSLDGIKSWTQRIQIALDVANGLLYLHNFTDPAYVHKHITSSNILLDHNLRAKIANFSQARTAIGESKSSATTTGIIGAKGYMAPEYSESGAVTPKLDVYAFGVVLLELITGKDVVLMHKGREVLLSTAVADIVEGENAETVLNSFIKPELGGDCGIEQVFEVAKLSLSCLMRDPANRPPMEEVVSSLLKIQVIIQKHLSTDMDFKPTI